MIELDLINKEHLKYVNFIKCNLIKEKEVASLETNQKLDTSVDTLINLVMVFHMQDFETSLNDLIKMFELNFFTVYNISKITR